MSTPPVILYRYDGSPFATKVSYILSLKGIPHKTVDVSMILPRPEITDLLGLNYRRIPILAIGNDVYCDTSLIASTVERRFPPEEGYATLFPPRKDGEATDIGLQKAFTIFYTDRPLFGLTASTIPYDTFPKEFLEDRGAFNGRELNVTALLDRQPAVLSALSSHLALVEQQLSDGREYYLDTVSPSLVDIAVYFNFSWIVKMKGMDKVLDSSTLPFFTRWFRSMKKKLEASRAPTQKIDGETAAKLITSAPAERDTVGFDELQGSFLKLRKGSLASVAPEDAGFSHPTTGKLLALGKEEIVLEVKGKSGTIRAHLPRLVFSATPVPQGKL